MFSGKKMLKILLFLVICISLALTLPLMVSANEVVTNELKTLYLHPNVNWETDNAWFALYYFDYNDHYDCVPMTDEDGDGFYEAVLPDGYPNFLFYRMDATVTEFTGDYVLHQTDCFEYAEDTHCYVLKEDSWEAGTWTDVPEKNTEETVESVEETTDSATGESVAEEDETGATTGSANVTDDATITTEVTDDSNEEVESADATEAFASAEEIKNITDNVSIETETVDSSAAETMPQTEMETIYLDLARVDQDYTWVVETLDDVYDVVEDEDEEFEVYSVELPVDTEIIILRGKNEQTEKIISSVEISLTDVQDNNCIVAVDGETEEKFEIVWGYYDSETGEVTIDTVDTLTIEEEDTDETVAAETTESSVETDIVEEDSIEAPTVAEETTISTESGDEILDDEASDDEVS